MAQLVDDGAEEEEAVEEKAAVAGQPGEEPGQAPFRQRVEVEEDYDEPEEDGRGGKSMAVFTSGTGSSRQVAGGDE